MISSPVLNVLTILFESDELSRVHASAEVEQEGIPTSIRLDSPSPFQASSTHKTHMKGPHARGKSCINDELTVTDVKPSSAALSPNAVI